MMSLKEKVNNLRLVRKDGQGNEKVMSIPKSVFIRLFKPDRITIRSNPEQLKSSGPNP
jgi:hypothetical protein